jgi:hypothetical protein
MHAEAAEFLRTHSKEAKWAGATVFEVGAYNVNGRARDFVPKGWKSWVGFDLLEGPDVDVVGDAVELLPKQGTCNILVSTEVLEHCEAWALLVEKMCAAVRRGGYLILTCAGPGRPEHSAGGGVLMDGEHYRNVSAFEIEALATQFGFQTLVVNDINGDAQYVGKKQTKK